MPVPPCLVQHRCPPRGRHLPRVIWTLTPWTSRNMTCLAMAPASTSRPSQERPAAPSAPINHAWAILLYVDAPTMRRSRVPIRWPMTPCNFSLGVIILTLLRYGIGPMNPALTKGLLRRRHGQPSDRMIIHSTVSKWYATSIATVAPIISLAIPRRVIIGVVLCGVLVLAVAVGVVLLPC